MGKYLIIMMLLLMISFSGIAAQDNGQGQGKGQDKNNQKISQNSISKYSQYYVMPSSAAPSTHIVAPQKYSIQNTPTTLYFGYQMQAIPYTQYQTYATYTGGNSLWIQGLTSLDSVRGHSSRCSLISSGDHFSRRQWIPL